MANSSFCLIFASFPKLCMPNINLYPILTCVYIGPLFSFHNIINLDSLPHFIVYFFSWYYISFLCHILQRFLFTHSTFLKFDSYYNLPLSQSQFISFASFHSLLAFVIIKFFSMSHSKAFSFAHSLILIILLILQLTEFCSFDS